MGLATELGQKPRSSFLIKMFCDRSLLRHDSSPFLTGSTAHAVSYKESILTISYFQPELKQIHCDLTLLYSAFGCFGPKDRFIASMLPCLVDLYNQQLHFSINDFRIESNWVRIKLNPVTIPNNVKPCLEMLIDIDDYERLRLRECVLQAKYNGTPEVHIVNRKEQKLLEALGASGFVNRSQSLDFRSQNLMIDQVTMPELIKPTC